MDGTTIEKLGYVAREVYHALTHTRNDLEPPLGLPREHRNGTGCGNPSPAGTTIDSWSTTIASGQPVQAGG